MNKASKKEFYLILILGLLTSIGPLSIDMYLPAFPEIARNLHTDVSQVMLSLSSFFIGISAGQLIYGPLLERFGRKKPLYAGLTLYLLASVGCALSQTVNMLIGFRLLQALGGCAGMVAARAIVRDQFDVKQNARIFSTLMLVVAVSPIIAPTLGGYITAQLGWRYVFGALILVNLAIMAGIYFFLKESREPDPGFSLRAGAITRNFWEIMRNPQFYTYALTGAFAYGGLSAYVSGSPYVFMELFGVNEKQYGWIFAIIAVGIISASQVNTLALKKYDGRQIIQTATGIQSCIGITMIILGLTGMAELYSTIFLIFLFLSCQGFVFPNASALSLAAFGHTAGSASALMGAIQMGIGAGCSALVSVFQVNSTLPMAGMMALSATTAFLFFHFGQKVFIQRVNNELVASEEIDLASKI